MRLTGQRLRSGLWIVADLTSTYEIEALAAASDQDDQSLWTIAGDGSQPVQPARISSNADGSVSADGFMNFSWRFSYLTFGMTTAWLTNCGLTSARSAPVTVMTYDETDAAVFLTALAIRPLLPGPDAQYAPGGYSNVIMRFTNAVLIT
jgi:hypothetical protein